MINDKNIVIVAVASVTADTENCFPEQTVNGTWIQTVPYDYNTMAQQAVDQLSEKILNHVKNVITCSVADDSHARVKSFFNERCRPRDVLSALGINLTKVFSDKFPNLENIFKIDAACASGIYAIESACYSKSINNGVIVIAGVEKPTALNFLNFFRHLGAVAENTEKPYSPFDLRRSGFVMAEGAALIAITTHEYAVNNNLDIVAEINSASSKTILTHLTSPSDTEKLTGFIHSVIGSSGLDLKNIGWWDAHATATPDGDKVEYDIFSKIFQGIDTYISSHKGRVGHCMSASAVVEIVNAIKCISNGFASETYGLDTEHSLSNDSRLIVDRQAIDKKTFLKTSFGFGGRNGAAIITVY
jgi:3-oxoacyl-(acyl-carrier-protein) synthase